MSTIADYQLTELLHDGPRSSVHRGCKRGQLDTVVIKIPKGGEGYAQRVRALEREWRLLEGKTQLGTIRALALERQGAECALILEDFGGSSLQSMALAGTLPLSETVSLGLNILDALEHVHCSGIIHNDLAPSNLLLRPTDGAIRIIDFASASMLAVKSRGKANTVHANLAYISPEQTGRLNRIVDYRSDYYSFGTILYELLTGLLPFNYVDALDLIHAHLARHARAPRDLNPAVPRALSRIVGKLIEKDAGDRYQSPNGIRQDLQRCRQELQDGREDFDFDPGRDDRFTGFRIPHALFGRDDTVRRLEAGFEACRPGGARLLAITGPAGIGKSSVAREIRRIVGQTRGAFATGKFEQYQAVPHDAFRQVFDDLVRQLVTENPESIQAWRARLLSELPHSSSVLLHLCPSLGDTLPSTSDTPALPAAESRTLLHEAASCLLGSLSRPERGICMLFDDVQWASPDSLSLLRHIILHGRKLPLMFILAFRDGDIPSEHPLKALLTDLRTSGILPVEEEKLSPLSPAALSGLVRDSLPLGLEDATLLAGVVFSRTGGNPFFAKAFLQSAYDRGLLRSGAQGGLDIELIRQQSATENIVELLVDRIGQLPRAARELLRVAACLGNRFDVRTLEDLSGTSGRELWPAIVADLVIPLDAIHTPAELEDPGVALHCRFAHDRIQQAGLSLLDEASRSALHAAIGRRLLSEAHCESDPNRLFEAVGHLNRALGLLTDRSARTELATLNLQAGRAALGRAAVAESIQVAEAGLVALGENAWKENYELARELHLVLAEAAFAGGSHERLWEMAGAFRDAVRSPADAARMGSLEGQVQFAQFRLEDALRTFREALAQLSVDIPELPSQTQIAEELRTTAELLRHRETEDLLALPACEDPEATLAMDLLGRLILAAGAATSPILPIAACRLVRLSVQRGNSPESANGYSVYGRLLSRDQDIDRAHRFAQLALDVAHRFNDLRVLSQTYLYANYQVMHWKVPLNDLTASFQKAVDYGLASGSPFNAASSAATLCICRFWAGENLSILSTDLEKYGEIIVRFRQPIVLNWHQILAQTVRSLRSGTIKATQLDGPDYDEIERVPMHEDHGDASALFNYHVAKALLCYLFGESQSALEHANAFQQFMSVFGSDLWAIPVHYLQALVRLGAAEAAGKETQKEQLELVEAILEKLASWAPYNQKSIAHKVLIVRAELERVRGHIDSAARLFEQATQLTDRQGSHLEQGIAWELAARFHAMRDDSRAMRGAVRNAHRAYAKWGSLSKLKQIETHYTRLVPHTIAGPVSFEPAEGSEAEIDALDFVSILNGSRLISQEIRRDALLNRLMDLLIGAAGAQIGFLLLPKEGHWVVECGQSCERGTVTLLQSVPLREFSDPETESLFPAAVHYVAGTGETLLLDDATTDARFAAEMHKGNQRPVSVLCFPLKHLGKLVAIAYLQNRLMRGAFDAARVHVLQLLCTQAVISLENAALYDDMERKVSERTQELREKNADLAAALKQLGEAQERLVTQEKLAAMGALAAGVAHEIRNPLNFINNFAEVCEDLTTEMHYQIRSTLTNTSPAWSEIQQLFDRLNLSLSKISEHGKRASAIVTAMAYHARDSGAPRELADINLVVAQSVTLALHGSASGSTEDIQLITEYDRTLPLLDLVVQDVSRVLVNLVSNACYSIMQKRRSSQDVFAGELRISTRGLPDTVEVRVRDNGVGIDPKIRGKIFSPFFTTKPLGEGTGIGLSIAHDIVTHGHGGQIRVVSVPGSFAEFTVELPRARAHT